MPGVTRPGTAALIATGCGTAVACVCAAGLLAIERLAGGVWAVAAVLVAGLLCFALARALARLSDAVPSGAGLLAQLSRAFGRRAGVALALPYLVLTLFLSGAEATVVGVIIAHVAGVPAPVAALAFLLGTWALCRAGVRIGYGAQAIATWALVAGLAALSAASIASAAAHGTLGARLLPAAPGPAAFAAAIGQSLFLFMGFELVTSHVEIAAPAAVRRALSGSVLVLAAFYALLSLGFSCAGPLGAGDASLVPQLAIAEQVGGTLAALVVAPLCLLASFTSFNGALLGLSRFTAALAAQGTLPKRLARVDPRTLVARDALGVLLAVALAATALVSYGRALAPAILAAAAAAAGLYAAAAWARELPPFAEPGRSRARRWAGRALAAGFAAVGAGTIAAAGSARPAALLLLAAAAAAAAAAAWRGGRPRTPVASRGPAHAK